MGRDIPYIVCLVLGVQVNMGVTISEQGVFHPRPPSVIDILREVGQAHAFRVHQKEGCSTAEYVCCCGGEKTSQ
jgi:hypothetical protein